jgi:hypothetical protein
VSNAANEASAVQFDGVAQIIAHVNAIVFDAGHTHVAVLRNITTSTVPVDLSGGSRGVSEALIYPGRVQRVW